jgi:hypothetical protein
MLHGVLWGYKQLPSRMAPFRHKPTVGGQGIATV